MAYKGFKGIGPRGLGTSPLKQKKDNAMSKQDLGMVFDRYNAEEGQEVVLDEKLFGPTQLEGPLTEDQDTSVKALRNKDPKKGYVTPDSFDKGYEKNIRKKIE
tara:strand:+ start:64 stop:372 length:309 start_codon:yes stop_codon:yes gene_type:complete